MFITSWRSWDSFLPVDSWKMTGEWIYHIVILFLMMCHCLKDFNSVIGGFCIDRRVEHEDAFSTFGWWDGKDVYDLDYFDCTLLLSLWLVSFMLASMDAFSHWQWRDGIKFALGDEMTSVATMLEKDSLTYLKIYYFSCLLVKRHVLFFPIKVYM